MKSYTDLNQSKKLAEMLPLESADMRFEYILPRKSDKILHNPTVGNPMEALEMFNKGYTILGSKPLSLDEYCIPCWSLASLLNVLPSHFYDETGRKSFGLDKGDYTYGAFYESKNAFIQTTADNPVDACVAMIERLHEQKLL